MVHSLIDVIVVKRQIKKRFKNPYQFVDKNINNDIRYNININKLKGILKRFVSTLY